MKIDTKTIEKFLSDGEISEIETILKTTEVTTGLSGVEHGAYHADYQLQIYYCQRFVKYYTMKFTLTIVISWILCNLTHFIAIL